MKYIISYNKLKSLFHKFKGKKELTKFIDLYLTDQIFPNLTKRGVYLLKNHTFWTDGERIVMEFVPDKYLQVRGTLWNNIGTMFGLNNTQIQKLLKEWVKKNLNIKIEEDKIYPVHIGSRKYMMWNETM